MGGRLVSHGKSLIAAQSLQHLASDAKLAKKVKRKPGAVYDPSGLGPKVYQQAPQVEGAATTQPAAKRKRT